MTPSPPSASATSAPPVTPASFYREWKRVCKARTSELLRLWHNKKGVYTREVLSREGSVVDELAGIFQLDMYEGYYSIDAIFFRKGDRVHCAPDGQCWVQNIRIAFEHENYFNWKLFQEVSHLMVTRAELRVLVTYPGNDDELAAEMRKIEQIIRDSGFGETCPGFLFIAGDKVSNGTEIRWRAWIYQGGQLVVLG